MVCVPRSGARARASENHLPLACGGAGGAGARAAVQVGVEDAPEHMQTLVRDRTNPVVGDGDACGCRPVQDVQSGLPKAVA